MLENGDVFIVLIGQIDGNTECMRNQKTTGADGLVVGSRKPCAEARDLLIPHTNWSTKSDSTLDEVIVAESPDRVRVAKFLFATSVGAAPVRFAKPCKDRRRRLAKTGAVDVLIRLNRHHSSVRVATPNDPKLSDCGGTA